MKEPRAVFSREGLAKYIAHITNIVEGLFFLTEHAEDLEIDDVDLEITYKAQNLFIDKKWLNRILD